MTPSRRSRRSLRSSPYVHRLKSLLDATEVLNSTFDLDQLLQIILQLALKNLSAERGTIYLIDEEREEIWSRVLTGKKMSEIRLPIGTGIAGSVAKNGRTVNLQDVSKDKRFQASFDRTSGFRTRTMLCRPMRNRNGKIVGVFQLLNKKKGVFTEEDILFLEAFSDHAVLAIENARLHTASLAQERVEKELQIAAAIQQKLLPASLPTIAGYDLAALAVPCKTVGGDFYDILRLNDDEYAIVMADVSGKGIPASLIVSNLNAFLKAYIEYIPDPERLVMRLNDVAVENTTAESFVTLFFLRLNIRTHAYTFVNAGHNAPYVVDGPTVIELPAGGLPLGMMEGMTYTSGTGTLPPGASIVLFTDGLPEAMDRHHELFGNERFTASVSRTAGLPASESVARVMKDVREFTGSEPPSDDMTMFVVRRV
jgi:sigma-B regulation protein RsbU (phosphoserine phosphatase)